MAVNKLLTSLNLAVGDIISAGIELQTTGGTAAGFALELVFLDASDVLLISNGTHTGSVVPSADSVNSSGPWYRSVINNLTIPAGAIKLNVGFSYTSLSISTASASGQRPVLNRGKKVAPFSRPSNDGTSGGGGISTVSAGLGISTAVISLSETQVSSTNPIFITATAPASPQDGWVWFDTGTTPTVDANTLEGQNSAYHLDWVNFTGKPVLVTQVDAEAGTVTTERMWSPLRVSQAITALETGGVTHYIQAATPASPQDGELWFDTGTAPIVDANTLQGQNSAYHLAWANFTGKPVLVTQADAEAGSVTTERMWSPLRVSQAIAALETTGPTHFIQSAAPTLPSDGDLWFDTGTTPTVDANTLEGQNSAYHLDWVNFTGKPVLVTQVDAEAGTVTTERMWSPLRVSQAISALGGAAGPTHFIQSAAPTLPSDGDLWFDTGTAPTVDANTLEGQNSAYHLDWANFTGKPVLVTQVDAEAGTVTTERMWSPLRVSQAIAALGGSGGGTAATTTVVTTLFGGILSSLETDVQKALDVIDDHTHSGFALTAHSHTGAEISALAAADTTSGTFAIARIPTGTSGTTVSLGNHGHSGFSLTSHTHTGSTISSLAAGDTTSGIFAIARIPTGTSSSTVSLGNHGHSGFALTAHSHTGAEISGLSTGDTTSGTFVIARIPTGTSSSTVSLGNHTHSGVALLTGASFSGAISAPTVSATSDIRLKNVFADYPLTDSLDAIYYDMKDRTLLNQHGYSAQEAQQVYPGAVFINQNGFLSLNYAMIHTDKIQKLENRLLKLEEKLNG